MKKGWLLTILFFCCVSIFQIGAQSRQELVIFTFDEMFPPEIFEEFTRETGIHVVLKSASYNEDLLAELERTNGAGYDLVIGDDYIVEFAIQLGFAQKLNRRTIRNWDNINPLFQYQFYDPNNDYTVPYGAGILTIVYDPARVTIDIRGYSDLWNPVLRNRVGIIGNYRIVNGFALQTMGKSFNVENVADITAAGQRLLSLAPNIRIIDDDTGALSEEILNGTIYAGIMYTESVNKARVANPNLRVVYPREGIGFGIMPAFIPSRAPNPAAAHRFLDFILDPQRGARCFEYLGYYCTFKASEQHIPVGLRELFVMPNYRNFEFLFNIDQDAEDAHQRIWDDFRAAVERAHR
jgi:spermidine/putrescine-binding protein